jgi:acetylornithine deacetylase/succinyl-diaminopimelate desuccinylase-like protein
MPSRTFLTRRRGAARFALYTSLLLTGVLALTFFPFFRRTFTLALDQSWAEVDWESLEEVRLLQELLRIDTTPETGSELAAARFLAAALEGTGAEVEIEALPGDKANLWAILEGRDRSALVLHSHLDTDPIREPEIWKHSPFSGTVEAPWIYGRGVFDMKSITIAQLQTFKALARDVAAGELQLPRSVVLLATSSEETDSLLGTRRILSEHGELTSRFWVVLTEGGVLEAVEPHSVKYWGTEFAQKRFVTVEATSAMLEPLEELRRLVDERGQPQGNLRLVPEVETFLAAYASSRDYDWHVTLLSDPRRLLREPARFADLMPYQKALFRDEIHLFPPRPAGSGFVMPMYLHLLPGSDVEEASALLLPDEPPAGVSLRREPPPPPARASPTDHPAFLAIESVVAAREDVRHHGPYFLSFYATDARFFRHAGIPSYGFTPFVVVTTDTLTITGPNERMAAPAFVDGVAVYEQVVRQILGADTKNDGPSELDRHELSALRNRSP